MSRDEELRQLLDAADKLRHGRSRCDRHFETLLVAAGCRAIEAQLKVRRQLEIVEHLRRLNADTVVADELLRQFVDLLTVRIQALKRLLGPNPEMLKRAG